MTTRVRNILRVILSRIQIVLSTTLRFRPQTKVYKNIVLTDTLEEKKLTTPTHVYIKDSYNSALLIGAPPREKKSTRKGKCCIRRCLACGE
jgi:hypothetical protein